MAAMSVAARDGAQAVRGELLALKRLPPIARTARAALTFRADATQHLTLYLMSSAYLGLDQQHDVPAATEA